MLLALNDEGDIVPSVYAEAAGFDIKKDSDMYKPLDMATLAWGPFGFHG
ncbi:MAG: hypothetical protein COB30_005280 [Ectothiorhodospiraceae bacterium]|nr:hypothetical protein [Ectothiorhodospiraceae bacterium]